MSHLVCAFAHVHSDDGLFVPLYRSDDRQNIYHVAVTGRDLTIEKFVPWLIPDEFITTHHECDGGLSAELRQRVVGDYSLVAFELNGRLIVRAADRIRELYSEIEPEIGGTLLDIQLGRIASLPLSQLHGKFVAFSSTVFRRDTSAHLFVSGSISLTQNDGAIWKSIDMHKSRIKSDVEETIREILSKDREELIQWLINYSHSELWPRIWSAAEDRIGFEARLEQLALDWLAAAEGDWLGDHFGTALFRRLLSSYRIQEDYPFEFTDAIFELITREEIFLPGVLLGADDYLRIYDIISKSAHFGSIDRVTYLANALRRTPYDANFIELSLMYLIDDLQKIDLSNFPKLRRSIIDYVVRSERLGDYRKFESIHEKLAELGRLMRVRHSAR